MPDKVVIRFINPRSPKRIEDSGPRTMVVYYWHRIIGAVVIGGVLLVALIVGVRNALQESAGPGEAAAVQSAAPQGKPEVARASAEVQSVPPAAARKPEARGSVRLPPSSPQPASEDGKAKSGEAARAVSGVLIRSRNITRAQLASNVVDGQPVDELVGIIPMNAKGLVKVFLYTETSNLQGRVLFHDWYWKEKLIAHARVPVRRDGQALTTSKFIDRIMIGPWQVKVVDDRKKVYAEARFEVR